MKFTIKILLLSLGLLTISCESLVDGINENPNELTLSDVDAELFLTGAMLANTVVQAGHLNRISGLYSGQLVGYSSLYSNIYGYSLSTAESVGAWSRVYIGVVPNVRHIRSIAPDDALLVGISKVLEAHAVGTLAILMGDVPYSQINREDVADPAFDSQRSVLEALVDLLDGAIDDLEKAVSRSLDADIYFDGDAD